MDRQMIEETAARMVAESGADAAAAKAMECALDYPLRHQYRLFWVAVRDAIRKGKD